MRNKILKKIAWLITKRPWLIFSISLILTAIAVIYSAITLELHTDQDDLVSEDIEYHKRYKEYLREFGDLEYLYIVVEVENNLDQAKQFAKDVGEHLKKIEDIKEVTYQINNPVLEKSFLLYLPKKDLENLTDFLSSGPTAVQKLSRWNSLSDVVGSMNRIMDSPQLAEKQEELKSGFHFLTELINGIKKTLLTGNTYSPNLTKAFLQTDASFDEDGYLLTSNGKLLFVLIMPEKEYGTLSVIEEPLKKIRNALDETRKKYPEVNAGLTGRPVLQADEMTVTNRDMTRATILAILAATILFVLYFRRLTRPIMAILSLIFGISWTFGFTTLTIGYLNLLSTVFAVILVGAGIEFGLQIVSRYREEVDEHKDPGRAVLACLTKTGRGNITAALTTAAAFFTALFTDFKALKELGLIAGSGIIFCLLSLLIVLPTMLFLRDRRKRSKELRTSLLIDLKGIENLYKRPVIIIVVLTILTVAGIPGLLKLKFDHNLLNLQAEGLESVTYEKLIIEESDESTWYAISVTNTKEEAKKIAKLMEKKGSVGKVETFEQIVPPDQKDKKEIVNKLRTAFSGVQYVDAKNTIDKERLLYNLKILTKNLNRLTEMAFSSGHIGAVNELERLSLQVESAYLSIKKASDKELSVLAKFQQKFIDKFQKGLKILESGLNPDFITADDLPETIRSRFISKDGRFATYIYPKENIWQPDEMKEFVSDIRKIDPEITGTPIEVYESSRLMQKSFQQAALYALLVIIILVMIDFRRPLYAFLSLTSLFAGMLWLLEIMGLAGIPFNLANFFAIPILLGVGVDNGVQIVHRYLQEDRNVKIMSKSTGAAVLLTSLTTGISFGMLIISQHRGIQSLGFIMALGAATILIGSLFLLPSLLRFLPKNKK